MRIIFVHGLVFMQLIFRGITTLNSQCTILPNFCSSVTFFLSFSLSLFFFFFKMEAFWNPTCLQGETLEILL
jgi:hypothetical protein